MHMSENVSSTFTILGIIFSSYQSSKLQVAEKHPNILTIAAKKQPLQIAFFAI